MDDFNYFKNKNKIEINIFESEILGLDDYLIEFSSKTNKVIVNIMIIKKKKFLK